LYVERIGTSIQQDLRKGFISWRAYMCWCLVDTWTREARECFAVATDAYSDEASNVLFQIIWLLTPNLSRYRGESSSRWHWFLTSLIRSRDSTSCASLQHFKELLELVLPNHV